MSNCRTCDIPGGTVPWSAYLPDVLMYVKDVPQATALNAVRDAAIDFSQFTNMLRRTVYIDVQANVPDYTFDVQDNYEPLSALSVKVGGYTRAFTYLPPYDLLITCPPSEDIREGIELELVVQPSRASELGDRRMYELFSHAVVSKAVAQLSLMRDSTWFDQTLSARMMNHYRNERSAAKARVEQRFTAGPTIIRPRRFV